MSDRRDSIPMYGSPSNALLTLHGRNASNSATIPSAASLPQNIFSTPTAQPTSVINLSNSNDVVIGPMTQYQGPVTIYQYMDATVEARAVNARGINQTQINDTKNTLLQRVASTPFIYFILSVIIIISVGLTTYFLLKNGDEGVPQPPPEILFGNNYEAGTFPNLGNGHLIVDRDQWGAVNERRTNITLPHPIPYVIISHVGVQSEPCLNIYKCSIRMRTYQDSSVAEKNLPDISSNFYVGGDGYIYVGRGWHLANTYTNHTLAISFIGDYIRYEPDEKQLEAVQYLLAYGLTNKYIALDYKLVAQNQTKSTKSPGTNIYKEIIKWPHWYDCGGEGKPRCGEELNLPPVWDAKQ